MKKNTLLALSLLVLSLPAINACRDESLNPLPQWEPGVHGYGVFVTPTGGESRAANAVNFPLATQATAKNDYKIRWVSLDQQLTVNKIEVYVDFRERFLNENKSQVAVSHGQKLLKTITPGANRVWSNFSVTPAEIYDLFKAVKFKYDGTNEVNVFDNPLRTPASRFLGARKDPDPNVPEAKKLGVAADDFVLRWRLYTPDGKVFKSWSVSVCTEIIAAGEANSNCELVWTVR